MSPLGVAQTHEEPLAARPGSRNGIRRRHNPPTDQLLPTWAGRAIRVLACLAIAVPVLYMLVLSFSPEIEVDAGRIIPSQLLLGNYQTALAEVDLLRGFLNSLIICGIAAAAAVLTATAAAYPLSRYRFFGSGPLLYGALGLQLVPGAMILLPFFVVFSVLQVVFGITVIGTYWGISLSRTSPSPCPCRSGSWWATCVPSRTELEEAAWVDGAKPVTALWRVVAPLAVPGMIVTFLFSLLSGWNDVLFASVLTSNTARTLAIDVQLFTATLSGQTLPAYRALMAAGVMAAAPIVVIYLLLQRYLVGGLAAGALR